MNKQRGGLSIELAGKNYMLAPTFEAIMAFEEKANVGVIEVTNKLSTTRTLSMKLVVAAIWSGIWGYYSEKGEEEKAPTFNEIGRLCLKVGLEKVIGFATVYILSMLASEEDREAFLQKQEEDEKKEEGASS